MKVLQINSVCGIGSTGRIATDIHNILIDQGHESYIAYGRDLPKNCDNGIKVGTRFDNYAHVVKTRIFDKHGFGSKQATLEFIDQVEDLDPDIIHLHNIHGYYINVELLFQYLKRVNKPVIWTLHDCWSFTGHCSHFDYVGCYKWKTGCYKCPQKCQYPKSLLADKSKDNYKCKKEIFTGVQNLTVVTPSKWLANLVEKSFLNEYSIQVINNGIDLSVFRPLQYDFRKRYNLEGKFLILGVANVWGERKGLGHYIDLSKTIKFDELIILVGMAEKQIKKLPTNIIGIEKTNDVKELAEIYSTVDVFVNPTLEDNFPTTNLEALACGTPVITFNTGGSIETVDEKTGIIVEKENIDRLNDAIKRIKLKGKKHYKEECIDRAIKLYDKENRFNDYINLYKNCLKL